MHYFPVALPILLLLALFLIFLITAIEVGILRYAFNKIGVGSRHMFALLILSFFGSYVNIPLWQLPRYAIESGGIIMFHGTRYVVPPLIDWQGTVVAINLGGGIIPIFLSLYLLVKNRIYLHGLLGTAIVAACVHHMAYLVRGVGIAEPIFIPPLIAAAVGIILYRQRAAPLAYISGSLGTLIGADLLNLGRVGELGVPMVSIGGAGTFDGIFLTGILSVLLASLFTGPKTPSKQPSE